MDLYKLEMTKQKFLAKKQEKELKEEKEKAEKAKLLKAAKDAQKDHEMAMEKEIQDDRQEREETSRTKSMIMDLKNAASTSEFQAHTAKVLDHFKGKLFYICLLYTSPSPRDS